MITGEVKQLIRLAWRYGTRQAVADDYAKKVGEKSSYTWFMIYKAKALPQSVYVRKLMREAYWQAKVGSK